MRAGISISIKEDENFTRFLTKNANLGNDVIKVVKEHGANMHQLAQQYAPVDTGFLKRHIKLDNKFHEMTYLAVVSGNAEYDPYQEYGTRYQPGTPHLRPALYNTEDKFIEDMDRLVRGNT